MRRWQTYYLAYVPIIDTKVRSRRVITFRVLIDVHSYVWWLISRMTMRPTMLMVIVQLAMTLKLRLIFSVLQQ